MFNSENKGGIKLMNISAKFLKSTYVYDAAFASSYDCFNMVRIEDSGNNSGSYLMNRPGFHGNQEASAMTYECGIQRGSAMGSLGSLEKMFI